MLVPDQRAGGRRADSVVAPNVVLRRGSDRDYFVVVDDVYFAYQANLVLRNISFRITRGEFVAIIGPSGCGKSTLLSIIQGLLLPSHGQVTVDGVPVDSPSGNRTMIFQHFALLPWKTVLGNVALGLKYQTKMKRREYELIARKCIELVGLSGSEHRYPHQLSGGMRQRVGIARAFAVEPAVLLLDEPFGALDAQNAEIMRDELCRLVKDAEMTAIMVTHNLDEALALSDRVIVMGPGVVIEDVNVENVKSTVQRGIEWGGSAEYRELRRRLWSIIRDEVMRSEARAGNS